MITISYVLAVSLTVTVLVCIHIDNLRVKRYGVLFVMINSKRSFYNAFAVQ